MTQAIQTGKNYSPMTTKKIIAICQSGGEFETAIDGSLSYNGGEAHLIHIGPHTQLAELKKEILELFSCFIEPVSLKYFLPGNNKTLITLSRDKDLERMLDAVKDSASVDVFIIPGDAIIQTISKLHASRSSMTTFSEALIPAVADDTAAIASVIVDAEVKDENSLCSLYTSPNEQINLKALVQWENTITGVDQRFTSLNEFREALHKYSMAHGFGYRYKKNDSHRVTVKCKTQGCPWKIYASRLSTTQLICIKRMEGEHTCNGDSVKMGYRGTKRWVGSIIKEKLKVSPNYRPKDIANDIQREFGIQLNYSQAWRAKELAMEQLQGAYREAYSHLPYFCEKIKESNPGSFVTFATKEDSSFHRLFISLHASVSGFQKGCRPLLFLSTTPLNSKYLGFLLAATAVDGDDGPFPLAFAVADTDNSDNWSWFLRELKHVVPNSPPVTFVADFQTDMRRPLAEVFENSHHAFCLDFLAQKLNNDLKGQFSREARRLMVQDLYSAAHARKPEIFQHCMESLKGISVEALNWAMQNEPNRWANAFFEGSRYQHMSSNFGQSFYGWLSESDDLPITHLVDAIREKITDLMYARRLHSSQWGTRLVPSKEETLHKESLAAQPFRVLLSQGSNVFEVYSGCVDYVDVEQWSCTCKEWQFSGIPCCHAMAVFECTGHSPYDYCSRYFSSEAYCLAYAESVLPLPNIDDPTKSELTQQEVVVTPPPIRRRSGRPKMRKIGLLETVKRQLQCSQCKGFGHNKKSCQSL